MEQLKLHLDKKQKRGLSAPTTRKLGIVCHSPSYIEYEYEVILYVVDVDQQSPPNIFNTVAPAVRFRFPIYNCKHAVCVLKSSVYMFGGYDPYYQDTIPEVLSWKFALPKEMNGNLQVNEDQLDPITPMNFPKAFPVALPTPDGEKILVFANYITGGNSTGAFDLFDPMTGIWEELPGLPYRCTCFQCRMIPSDACARERHIRRYSFLDKFHFLVDLDLDREYGSFVLDLEKKEWTFIGRIFDGLSIENHDWYRFVTAKGGFVLTSEGSTYLVPAFRTEKEAGESEQGPDFPLSKFPPPNTHLFDLPSIVCLGEEDDEICETAILQIERISPFEGSNVRLLIDVHRTELTPPIRTTLSNSVGLRIDCLRQQNSTLLISI